MHINENLQSLLKDIEKIKTDPCASFWLKSALSTLENRDSIDVANDACVFADLASRYANCVCKERGISN